MKIDFWFEFASTYSYLSAMRLPAQAAKAGVTVRWRPFLLGPIFAAQDWNTSPFNIYAAKGNYMWRDMARQCDKLGLSLQKPNPFPQNGLLAARVATAAIDGRERVTFIHNIYLAEFSEGLDISDPDVVAACASAAGLPAGILDAAQSDATKSALRATTEDAAKKGLFGAPSFTVGEELFWGDDRMEQALDWAVRHG